MAGVTPQTGTGQFPTGGSVHPAGATGDRAARNSDAPEGSLSWRPRGPAHRPWGAGRHGGRSGEICKILARPPIHASRTSGISGRIGLNCLAPSAIMGRGVNMEV